MATRKVCRVAIVIPILEMRKWGLSMASGLSREVANPIGKWGLPPPRWTQEPSEALGEGVFPRSRSDSTPEIGLDLEIEIFLPGVHD